MNHTLNERRDLSYATQEYEQEDIPQKLQTRNTRKQEELTHDSNEGRRPSIDRLTEVQKTYLLEEIFDFFEELILHYEGK